MKTKIYIGSDHAGFKTKEALKNFLITKKLKTVDVGAFKGENVDYPDYAEKVGRKVAKDKGSLGILICGTGIGMSIAANKVKGIRAANPFNEETAKLAKEHNDANIICIAGRTYKAGKAKKIISAFLKAKSPKEARHKKRIKKISKIEEKK